MRLENRGVPLPGGWKQSPRGLVLRRVARPLLGIVGPALKNAVCAKYGFCGDLVKDSTEHFPLLH